MTAPGNYGIKDTAYFYTTVAIHSIIIVQEGQLAEHSNI